MRWSTFAIFAFVALVLDQGLRGLLSISSNSGPIAPSFTLILLVYVAMSAPPMAVAWAAVVLGVLADLTTAYPFAGQPATGALLGPAVLGYLAGGYAATQVRNVIFRQSRLAAPIMVLAAGAFVHLAMVALLTVRGLGFVHTTPIEQWDAADELFARFLTLVYSAVVSLPIVAMLQRAEWLWGFAHAPHRPRRTG